MGSPTSIKPPFTRETAIAKIRAAEDAWNSRDAEKVSMAYSVDSRWRNRNQFINGREAIREFLADKWDHELEYRLAKQLCTSIKTPMGNGFVLTEMRIGSLMTMD